MHPVEQYHKKTNTGHPVRIRIPAAASAAAAAPTAVLVGWLGASLNNLAKYAAIYEAMRYNTVALVTPPSVVFAMRPLASANFLLSVLRILSADPRLTAGGVVFHKFSNAGATLSPHLSRFFAAHGPHLLRPDDQIVVNTCKHAIAAVVFDSAPCYMHVHAAAAALSRAFAVRPGLLFNLLFAVVALLSWLQRVFIVDLPVVFWRDLTRASYLCPEQYIYSAADPLLDPDALHALIHLRKARGVDARVWRVPDADHVLILRKHPEKYVDVIRALNHWGINAWRARNNAPLWQLPPLPPQQHQQQHQSGLYKL
ncbi:unnamed protein product [Agarophyton chilense]